MGRVDMMDMSKEQEDHSDNSNKSELLWPPQIVLQLCT